MSKLHRFSKLANWILKKVLPSDDSETAIGDFEEFYRNLVEEKGNMKAIKWFWKNVFFLLPQKIQYSLVWSLDMFKNYLKIAIRNIKKYKAYSFINIFGLAIGMACCLLITLWVRHELSYDSFHENVDNLYRVDWLDGGRSTAYPLAPAIKAEVPEITDACRFDGMDRLLIQYEQKIFFERDVVVVDPSFFQMLTFPFISGNL